MASTERKTASKATTTTTTTTTTSITSTGARAKESSKLPSTTAVRPGKTVPTQEEKDAIAATKLRESIIAASSSAASKCRVTPIDAGDVKKSHVILIRGQPCKVLPTIDSFLLLYSISIYSI